jgi:hypothetical protein
MGIESVQLLETKNALTSLFKASAALPRSAGSIARRVSSKANDELGNSLKVSIMHRL